MGGDAHHQGDHEPVLEGVASPIALRKETDECQGEEETRYKLPRTREQTVGEVRIGERCPREEHENDERQEGRR